MRIAWTFFVVFGSDRDESEVFCMCGKDKNNFECRNAKVCHESKYRNFLFCLQTCLMFGCAVCIRKESDFCLDCSENGKK